MAKGDFILFDEVPFRSVTSHPRRYGVMFDPSSSRSRLRVIDAGRRYAVRLRDGVVEYSIDGDVTWQQIDSFADPCTGQKLPKIVSHEKVRVGEELTNITFDMIAVGRGRLIAKEANTDRLFHLYINEMFRTHTRTCNPGEPGVTLDEDPPVPPFNMKLDPEYFTMDPPTLIVPPEGTRDYAKHPGSLRLPVFNLLLELDIADVMLVLERARTWYLKDTRSQQAIMGPEDFNFSEEDFKTVFTEAVLRDILESLKSAAIELSDNPFTDFLVWVLGQPNDIARDWRKSIEEKGYSVLVFPAYAALGGLLYSANFVKAVQPEVGGRIRIDLPALRNFFASQTDNAKAQGFINDAAAKLFEAISELRLRSRRKALRQYGARPDVQRVELPPEWTIENRMPTPNQPPAWMPSYVRTRYVRSKGIWRGVWKKLYGKNDKLASVWLGTNADGRLEAFGIAEDNTAWHTFQMAPNGSWNGEWIAFHSSSDKLSKLAIARNSDGRLEVFGVSPDDRVWHTWQETPNGNWSGWGGLYSAEDRLETITAARNHDGRLEVFGVGADRRVWHTWQTKAGADWLGHWEELYSSADKLRDVWATSNADGRLEVFGISPDNNRVWHTFQDVAGEKWNGSWTELYNKDDQRTTLAVGRNQDGRLELFGISPDQRIWHTSQQSAGGDWIGSWSEFYTSGDKLSDLWVVSNTDGRLEVFGVLAGFPHLDDRVWHTWQSSPNGNWNGAWIQIEAEFGRRTLAVATNADGEIEIVGITNHPLTDNKIWNTRLLSEKRYAIEFSRVLDIGIGSSHWSEQWLTHYGGEIHALPARRPVAQQERYSLTQYRFLNGPVIDGDAYNDGTTNFYMLVKLGAPGSDGAGLLQRYAILWFDEQTYFTQRWRLVHPTDDILGDLFSLPHYLRTDPDWYDFSLAKFWSPFTSDLINDNSRMAVRRNIITLTGFNQSAQRHEIYTICFNYGMCDHTWRWRLFPPAEQVLIDSTVAQDPDPQLPDVTRNGPANAYVVVNTLDLRDDTTLHVRGSKRSAAGAPLRAGRWVQRYLPADCKHVPAKHQLTAGTKPASGFNHAWDFISETAYRRADLFYQFGIYENRLDSRCQYYEVDLLPGANGALPRVEDVVGHVWGNDKNSAGDDRLRIHTINFTWGLQKTIEDGKEVIIKRLTPVPGEEVSDETIAHEYRKRSSMSLFEPTARFRILERKPLGLIAAFYDKRDDDLQTASDLPQPTIFRKDRAEANIPDAWKIEDGDVIGPAPDPTPADIRVLIKTNKRTLQPPNVRKAQIIIDKAPGLRALNISFWTPQTEQEVCENIWRVSLAALDNTGVVPLFSVTRFPNFVRRAVPDAPLPLDFAGELGDAWRYDFTWTFPKEIEANVRRFCTPHGHVEFATSLWFEDVVGHRALAQELIFA